MAFYIALFPSPVLSYINLKKERYGHTAVAVKSTTNQPLECTCVALPRVKLIMR